MKVVKGILSTLLAIVVVPVLLAFIIYLSTNSILSKKNVEKLVKEADVSDFLKDENGEYTEFGKELREDLINNGLPEAVVDEFVNSKEITDFVTDYASNIINYVVYDEELKEIKAEDVSKLINDNVDSIVAELRAKRVEGYEELTEERVSEFKSHVEDISKEVEKSIPDMKKEIEDSEAKDVIGIIRFVFSSVVYIALVTVILILLLIILLLNRKKYNFLIWYGVIFMIASLPIVLFTSFVSSIEIESNSRAMIDIIKSVFNKLSLYSYIFFFMGIILIIVAVILKTATTQDEAEKTGI